MTYYLAPSLVALRDEINAAFPKRDKRSDGWIGDASHSARKSGHNPDYSAGGVVRATDTDVDDNDAGRDLRKVILEAVIGDPRVWYVISNGIIYSRTYGWAARTYTGSNGHYAHVHVEIRSGKVYENDTSKWLPAEPKRRVKPLAIDLKELRAQMFAARDGKPVEFSRAVKRFQHAMNLKYGRTLKVDGYAGKATLDAEGRHERAIGVTGAPRIPDQKSLAALLAGRYRMVAGKDRK